MTKQGSQTEKIKTITRELLAKASSWRYGNPAKKLTLIGVTGTKGKTITTQMIYHILQSAGLSTGYISTIAAKIGDQELDTGFHVTSPEPWELPKYLSQMVKAKVKYVVIEATSQGLQQGRLAGLEFDAAVITNIDNDHLDYHLTWEKYAEAKFQLIEQLKPQGVAVVNADHISSDWLKARAELLQKDVVASWFSKSEVTNFTQSLTGMEFDYKDVHFQVPVFGSHMLENVLAAIKVTDNFLELSVVAEALTSYKLPPGRMQIIQAEPFTVIVDFAHTPDSMARSLEAIDELKQDGSRVITVFGCAGDRDPSRRMMAVPATKYSKFVILTAEDPRNEELTEINSQIYRLAESVGGVLLPRFPNHDAYRRTDLNALLTKAERVVANQDVPFVAFDEMNINSRIDAIEFALSMAHPGDIVFITGKGHEKSLCFENTEYEWSDQAVVKNILASGTR